MANIVDIQLNYHRYDLLTALEDCQLSIPKNSLSAIVGPNGAGKSTLLKIIAGLIKPTSGRVQYNGITPSQIAYLGQSSCVDRTFPLRVEDVVAMGLWSKAGGYKRVVSQDREKIKTALKSVGLEGFEKRTLMALSGGQLQRLFFARAITQDAQFILLDEPFSGIDQPTVQDLITIISTWITQGKTVLVVLHDIPLVRQYFPSTILIARKLIAHGPTADVLTPAHLTKAIFDV